MTAFDLPAGQEATGRQERDLLLHTRLLARETDASRDALHSLMPRLQALLRQRFSGFREDEIEDVAWETVSDYAVKPERYRSDRRSLMGFLYMVASRDLLNALERKKRVVQLELSLETESVAEDPAERKRWLEAIGDIAGLPADVTLEDLRARIRVILPDVVDQEFVKIMCSGEEGFEAYVPLLRLEGLGRAEQQAGVSKRRNRIQKALRRLGEGYTR